MSKREYTVCDGKECGNCSMSETPYFYDPGWSRLETGSESYDLCPDCTAKAMELLEVER